MHIHTDSRGYLILRVLAYSRNTHVVVMAVISFSEILLTFCIFSSIECDPVKSVALRIVLVMV